MRLSRYFADLLTLKKFSKKECKKVFDFFLIMYELDVPSQGSQESIAPNRYSKFDREHAFLAD